MAPANPMNRVVLFVAAQLYLLCGGAALLASARLDPCHATSVALAPLAVGAVFLTRAALLNALVCHKQLCRPCSVAVGRSALVFTGSSAVAGLVLALYLVSVAPCEPPADAGRVLSHGVVLRVVAGVHATELAVAWVYGTVLAYRTLYE